MHLLPLLLATGAIANAVPRPAASPDTVPDLPQVTQPPAAQQLLASTSLPDDNLWARSAAIGDDCMTTFDKSTLSCPVRTVDGSTSTATGDECTSTVVDASSCLPGKTCSFDSSGQNICMDLENSLDTAGIIISIVFAVLIVLGVSTLTWLCCKDRKEQKRMAAKAEATALARAATKKKKAAEARDGRAPLMDGKRDAAGHGAADPFHDRNTS